MHHTVRSPQTPLPADGQQTRDRRREVALAIVDHAAVHAVGVSADGRRESLGLGLITGEDGAGWTSFLRGLVARGLAGVVLVTSDAHQGLVAALAATGFYAPERRPYLPHLTVARYRRPGPPFSLQNVTLPRLCLSRLVLYTSVLDRGGAVHTPLAAFAARQERSPAP